jgi:DNA-binding transcriptional MerR regulator/methylmalonyl-CoA mutase cobalamin-binding subunit
MARDDQRGIGAVERETGISKETLRIWERRYGFPKPERVAAGDRAYAIADVSKLRILKQLIDQGLRPSDIVSLSEGELLKLSNHVAGEMPPQRDTAASQGLSLFKKKGAEAFDSWLQKEARTLGLADFVLRVVPGLCADIGRGWQDGQVAIFEEHILTERIIDVLRTAISNEKIIIRKPILLATLPLELHSLGLLMLQALLAAHGVGSVSLGAHAPIEEIARCTRAGRFDVVAVSFSTYYPARRIRPDLKHLRSEIPPTTQLWAGGGAVSRMKTKLEGVLLMSELSEALVTLRQQALIAES